jgi:hypothetical protein
MLKYPYRTCLRSLLLTLAFALTQPASALAQELSFSALTPASAGLPVDPGETAAVEHLPSAPMNNATGAGEAMFPASPAAMAPMAVTPVIVEMKAPDRHRFWDRENSALFLTVGAFAAADFCSTRANLASGGKELNPVTRVFSGSTPGLAANFALETGGVMAVSYLFHKTGHHKLERMTSFVNISASASAVGYSLAHR